MTTYEVTIGERVVRVALRSTDAGMFARIDDGAERLVHLATLHGVLRSLDLDGARSELLASPPRDGVVDMVINGLEYHASVIDEARARLASVAGSHAGTHARAELKAPMPGLVVRVLCAVDDEVAANQPLAVLQAMKMENELTVPRGGKVTGVNVSEGQTVEQGQVLITVE